MASNSLAAKHQKQDKVRSYLIASNDFWMDAISYQGKRCRSRHDGEREFAFDLMFYVTAVQRLREVARMAATSLKIDDAQSALELFDQQWPKFRDLRNLLEHLLLPNTVESRIEFFPGVIAEVDEQGQVSDLINVEETASSIEELHAKLAVALKAP